MSLLKRIQDNTLENDCDVANLLRRCKVLAAQADAPELASWVDHELRGYPAADALPNYRLLKPGSSKGHFSGPFGRLVKNAEIPIHTLPPAIQPIYRVAPAMQRVEALQAAVDGASNGSTLARPWSTEAVQLRGDAMYDGMTCTRR
jgi:hypothetical protein